MPTVTPAQTELPAATPHPPIKGVRDLTATEIRWQRISVLWITISPVVVVALAVWLSWGTPLLGWTDVAAFAVMYALSGFGITIGFHRLLTHQSFDAPPWLRTTFAALGSLAIEGSVLTWVADHRRHHAYSDRDGDPHSPHLHDDHGFRGLMKGLWHAHIGWLFKKQQSEPQRWAPDLVREPGIAWVDRRFLTFVVLSYALPATIGLALSGSLWGAFTALLWGGFVRMLVLHHVTWSTNSICHVFGARPYRSNDMSTNNWALSIVSGGESWHNTHHAFPSSAVHGLEWWQPDISGSIIRLMARVGLAGNVRLPSAGARARKRL